MGPAMVPYPARFSAIMLVLAAIVAPVSEAQARHGGHWRSFGYWGHGQYQGRHDRSSANEEETDDWGPRGRAPARYGRFNNPARPPAAAMGHLIQTSCARAPRLQP